VVFVTLQNLFDSIIASFNILRVRLENVYTCPRTGAYPEIEFRGHLLCPLLGAGGVEG